MSLFEVQKAVATIIRRPETFGPDFIDEVIKEYDLSPEERWQVKQIAQQHQVQKYGKKLRRFRLSDTVESMEFLEDFISFVVLKQVWEELFEPKAVRINNWEMQFRFLEFLATDEEAQNLILKDSPPFAVDYLKFQYVLEKVETQDLMNRPISKDSLLVHPGVELLTLNYDIPALQQLLWSSPDQLDVDSIRPEPQPIHLAFLQTNEEGYKMFQIDQEMKRFFEEQLSEVPPPSKKPASYEDLVSLGIAN